MRYRNFTMQKDGFVGHLAEPETPSGKAVIVVMGGEKSLLPGIRIAERFADHGITGLAVSLFGAPGLPEAIDRVPLDMFAPAVRFLREEKGAERIGIYGMSMGSVFAVLAAQYIGGIDDLVLCSPTHVPFEGTLADRQTVTNHSIATYQGEEIPFVPTDFSVPHIGKYCYDDRAGCEVTRMWQVFRDAYSNKEAVRQARLHPELTGARILLIAGSGDECWPSAYSVDYLQGLLNRCGYEKTHKRIIYRNASHLIGVMPDPERSKWLYRAIGLVGLRYRRLNEYRDICLRSLRHSEREIIQFLLHPEKR